MVVDKIALGDIQLRSSSPGYTEEIAESLAWTTEEVRLVSKVTPDAGSLDRPSSDEPGATELRELFEDEPSAGMHESVAREMELEWLRSMVDRLPVRTRYVLVRRHGLDDEPRATLAALARELGCSRETIRRLQAKAELTLRVTLNGNRARGPARGLRSGA